MRVSTFCAAVALFGLCSAANEASAASILYGSNGNSGINPGAVVTVNQTTGAGTFVGDPTVTGGLSGLVFSSTGVLYGTTVNGVPNTSSLIIINPSTGALISTVGSIGISIGDLAWDPIGNELFGIRSNSDGANMGGRLYKINTSTAAPTFLGNTGAGAGGGLAFAPDGTLYQTAYNNNADFFSLNTLNKTNASRIATVAVGFYFDGLGVRDDGVLFAVPGGIADAVYTVNPITGASTLLGATGTGSLSDVAFTPTAVPEPGTLVLLGLGLAAAWRRRTARG